MPDNITPVGTQNNYDPTKPISFMSGLLGLQQQKQQLQTGQYVQQSAAAAATSNTQNTKEKMDLAQLLVDPIKAGILDEHGQVTPGAQGIVMHAAPTTGAQHYEQIVSAAKAKVDYNTSVNSLNASERAEAANAVRPALADPDAKVKDVTEALDALMDAKRGTPAEEDYRKITDFYKKTLGAHASQASAQVTPPGQEGWRQAGQRLALSMDPSGAGPQIGTGASGEQVVRKNALAATQQRVGGYNPNTPAVAGQTELNVGASRGDVDRANEVSAKAQAASGAVILSQQVDSLARDIYSGKVAAMISAGGNYLGMSSMNEVRSKLEKDLGQLKGAVADRAGSDARAGEILKGYPTDTSPEGTIHYAMDYIRGTARQDLARSQLLQKHGRAGFQMADTQLTNQTNPLMHEFMALKTPQERTEFYKRNFRSREEAIAFKNSLPQSQSGTRAAGGG